MVNGEDYMCSYKLYTIYYKLITTSYLFGVAVGEAIFVFVVAEEVAVADADAVGVGVRVGVGVAVGDIVISVVVVSVASLVTLFRSHTSQDAISTTTMIIAMIERFRPIR